MAEEQQKEKKQEPGSGRWQLYDGAKRKNKTCPKCGDGTFLAQHKNRSTCGSCQYTEFSEEKPKEDSPQEKPKDTPEADPKKDKPKA